MRRVLHRLLSSETHVEHQEDAGQRQVVDQVAQVDHAALDALEAAARAQRAQDVAERRPREVGHAARADQVEQRRTTSTVRISATIWLSVREETNRPMAA